MKNKFVCINLDFIITTSKKNFSKVGKMILMKQRTRGKVIKIKFNDVFDIVKCVGCGPLESSTNIFQTKGQFTIGKCSPREEKSSLMLVFKFDLNLVIAGITINKLIDRIVSTCAKNLVDKRCSIIIFLEGQIQFTVIITTPSISTQFHRLARVNMGGGGTMT